jgi:hypothetical protein
MRAKPSQEKEKSNPIVWAISIVAQPKKKGRGVPLPLSIFENKRHHSPKSLTSSANA